MQSTSISAYMATFRKLDVNCREVALITVTLP